MMIDAHSFNNDARGNRTTAERTSYRADNRGRALVSARGVSIAILAMVVAVVVASGTAAAADPGTHEVQITNGSGDVNASYQYDASAGTIEASYDSGSEVISLGNPDESALAIQWAIDNSSSTNDTILIGPGTYNGSVNVTTANVTIEGSDNRAATLTKLRGQTDVIGFNVRARNVQIASLTVDGFNKSADDAIYLGQGSTGSSIKDIAITDTVIGIRTQFSDTSVIRDSDITGSVNLRLSPDVQIYNNSFGGTGTISIRASSDRAQIYDNTFDGSTGAIHTAYASDAVIRNNTFINIGHGAIELRTGTENNTVIDNHLNNVDTAIVVDSDDKGGNTLQNNTIVQSVSGIVIKNEANVISSNEIHTANEGIRVAGATGTLLADNDVNSSSGTAVLVNGSADTRIDGLAVSEYGNYAVHVENHSHRTVVAGTVVTNNGGVKGIFVEDSSDVEVRDGVLDTADVKGEGAPRLLVQNNTLTSGTITVDYGSDDATIVENDLTGGAYAVYTFRSAGVTITRNVIDGSGLGIDVSTGSESFTVTENEITNTGSGIVVNLGAGDTHTIRDNLVESGTDGIVLRTNDTIVENNTITDNSQYGIHLPVGTNNTVVDNDVRRNQQDGIFLDDVAGNLLDDNDVVRNQGSGIFLRGSNDTIVRSNFATGNLAAGIDLEQSWNVTIEKNVLVTNHGQGVRLRDSDGNEIINNEGSDTGTAISLAQSDWNTVEDNHVRDSYYGIFLSNAHNNDFARNNASQMDESGVTLGQSRNNTFTDTIVNDNGRYGIEAYLGAYDNKFDGVTANGNTLSAYHASDLGGTNALTGLDVGAAPTSDVTLDLEGGNVSIAAFDGSVGSPDVDLTGLGGMINVTNTSSAATVDLAFQYSDADVSGLDESSVGLWNHTAGNWSEVTGASIDSSTNTVSVDLEASETLGLFAESTSASGASGSGGGGYYLPPSSDSGPEFTVTSIDLSSDAVAVGETVTVTIHIDNDGDEHGDYTGTLTAEGQSVDSGTVTVNSNWHNTLRLSTTFDQPGTYQLAVDGQSAGSVEVTGASAFSVSDVSLSPTSVESGGTVTITATVTNDGSAEGTVDVPLVVDGEEVDSRSVTLRAGESETVSFERTFDEPGSVSIGGVTAGSVEMQTGSGDGGGDGGSDGGVGLVVFLFGGFGLVAVGLAGAYFLYPEKVLEAWQQVQSKVEDLTGGSR